MKLEDIQARIEDSLVGSKAIITDLKGGDHIHAEVIYEGFAGKSLIAQHRMILDLFETEIASNDVHALSVKTKTQA